jgi:hypothetical protein
MLCYSFPWPSVPPCCAKVSSWFEPLLDLVDQIMSWFFPHTTEQDSQPTTSLTSSKLFHTRHVVTPVLLGCLLLRFGPEQIRAWLTTSPDGFQPSPPFQPMLKPQPQTSPRSTHITADGRPTLSMLAKANLNIIKMEDLYDSHDYRARQYYPDTNPNRKSISRDACNSVTRGRKHIGSTWSRNTCLASCLLLLKVLYLVVLNLLE